MNIHNFFSSVMILMLVSGYGFSENSIDAENPIEITKLDDGVWLHTSYYTYPNHVKFPSNGLIVKEGQELTLIDTAWGELQTVQLLKAIKLEINLPVSKAIVTHAHSDRAAGVDVLESSGVEVYSHPLTKRFTIENGSPVPNKTLDAITQVGSSMKFGSLEVFFPGAAHAMDNVMVWLPEKKTLFGGCAIRAMSSKSAGNTVHGDIQSWQQVIKHVKEEYKHAMVVVPGHGNVGGVELLAHTEKMVLAAIKGFGGGAP